MITKKENDWAKYTNPLPELNSTRDGVMALINIIKSFNGSQQYLTVLSTLLCPIGMNVTSYNDQNIVIYPDTKFPDYKTKLNYYLLIHSIINGKDTMMNVGSVAEVINNYPNDPIIGYRRMCTDCGLFLTTTELHFAVMTPTMHDDLISLEKRIFDNFLKAMIK